MESFFVRALSSVLRRIKLKAESASFFDELLERFDSKQIMDIAMDILQKIASRGRQFFKNREESRNRLPSEQGRRSELGRYGALDCRLEQTILIDPDLVAVEE